MMRKLKSSVRKDAIGTRTPIKARGTQPAGPVLLGDPFLEPVESLDTILAAHPFLRGMSAAHLAMVTKHASLQSFNTAQELLLGGEDTDYLYLVHSGQLEMETFVPGRGVVGIETLNPGDALGWTWLFSPGQCHFRARVVEGAELIAIDAAELRVLAEKHPAFGFDLARRVAGILVRQLQATHKRLVEFYGESE
ncbi:MAG: cyclic nucleotide-binding domain-containing protein [Verrucomicrobiota bacterium]